MSFVWQSPDLVKSLRNKLVSKHILVQEKFAKVRQKKLPLSIYQILIRHSFKMQRPHECITALIKKNINKVYKYCLHLIKSKLLNVHIYMYIYTNQQVGFFFTMSLGCNAIMILSCKKKWLIDLEYTLYSTFCVEINVLAVMTSLISINRDLPVTDI